MKADHITHFVYVKKYLQKEIQEYERDLQYFENRFTMAYEVTEKHLRVLRSTLEEIEKHIENIKNPLPF